MSKLSGGMGRNSNGIYLCTGYERIAEALCEWAEVLVVSLDYKADSCDIFFDMSSVFQTNSGKVLMIPCFDTQSIDVLQDLILNFVEFGNPVVHGECEWMPYSKEHRERLLIDEICTKEEMFPMYDKQFPLQVFRLEKPVV